MTSKFSVWVKKFAIPLLFLVLGVLMLVITFKENQGEMFLLASVMMILAGILSILFSTGKLKSVMVYGIGGITGIAAVLTLFFSVRSCKQTQIHDENYKYCKSLAIQNLMDIRDVQKIYREQNGKYAGSWEEFDQFLKTGKVEWVESKGTVPARRLTVKERDYLYGDNRPLDYDMTVEEAWRLSKWPENPSVDENGVRYYEKEFKNFVRDTNEVSLIETKFTNNLAYKQGRKASGFPDFNPDSLKFIPCTKAKDQWLLEVRDSVNFSDAVIPTIKVSGFIPFSEIQGTNNNRELIFFGNLLTNSTSGSWEE